MMNLFKELNIEDRLQWKIHQMIFAMQEFPGIHCTTLEYSYLNCLRRVHHLRLHPRHPRAIQLLLGDPYQSEDAFIS